MPIIKGVILYILLLVYIAKIIQKGEMEDKVHSTVVNLFALYVFHAFCVVKSLITSCKHLLSRICAEVEGDTRNR